jgi:type I restriction enzyme, S subunit
MFQAESYEGHKLCRPDDLVVNTMWAWMGALGVSSRMGIVSPSYGVHRPRATGQLLPQFADHLLRTRKYVDEYIRQSTGIHSSRLRLYPDQFLNLPLLVPPLSEQAKILDAIARDAYATATAIARAQKEIALIGEYRTRLISDVVTGKLDARGTGLSLPDSGSGHSSQADLVVCQD